jgi:membrane-associated phospholipid phosphatase
VASLETVLSVASRKTSVRAEPFLAWPGWDHLRYAGLLSSMNALWFAFIYAGADYLTGLRSFRVPVYFPAELAIPFVPAMTVFYMSLYFYLLLAPFILRTAREFRALVITLAIMIFFSGIGFLLFPADLAFAPPQESDLGIWAGMFHFADWLNLTYNLVPSLHVAFAVACAAVLSSHAQIAGKVLLWLWAAMIAASTVLIHQHHLLDVATGWLLALVCVRTIFYRLTGNPREQ